MGSSTAPVWFITGASNGLGLSIALTALGQGQQVIAAMRNPTRAAHAAKAVEEAGGRVFQLDVAESQAAISSKMREAEAIHGRIDVLVNNAGYSTLGSFENFTEKEVKDIFQTNVFGPLYVTQPVLPGMRSRRSGTIINVSSVAGQDAQPTCSLYAGTKFGLEGLSEGLSREVEEFGISVLIVQPGAFRTNFLGAMNLSEKGIGSAYEQGPVGQTLQRFQAANGKQAGDPDKAARRIVEAATGTGEAGHLKGRVLRLVLGQDAHARITRKMDKLREDMEVAREVTFGTNFD